MNSKKRLRMGYLFIAPYFIVFAIFSAYPIFYSFYLSFTEWRGFGDPVWVGGANYARLMRSPFFFESVTNTLLIWIMSIIPQLTIAIIIALILNSRRIRGRSTLRSIYYFPNLVTPVTIAVTFSLIFGRSGALNNLLMGIGIIGGPITWTSPFMAKLAIAIMIIWQNFGFNIIFLGAGLSAISREYYEAAEVDGAGAFAIATRITLPLMRPILVFILITSIIGGLQIFDLSYIFTGGEVPVQHYRTMIHYMFEMAFDHRQFGFSAAAAYAIFVIIAGFSTVAFMIVRERKEKMAV